MMAEQEHSHFEEFAVDDRQTPYLKYNIVHQEEYSRGDLLLRAFFGWLYIGIPHFFMMLIPAIVGSVYQMISFWLILFTGKMPEEWFNHQVKLQRWGLRVNARALNLVDGYPATGMNATDDKTELEVQYPGTWDRGTLLLTAFFGWLYCGIPHVFLIMIYGILGNIYMTVAFFMVLFTGKYPENWHTYIVNDMRWGFRVNLYMSHMTQTYPPFNGRP